MTCFTIVLAILLVYVKSVTFKRLCVIAGYLAAAFSVGISILIAANAYRVYDYVWNADRTKKTLFL